MLRFHNFAVAALLLGAVLPAASVLTSAGAEARTELKTGGHKEKNVGGHPDKGAGVKYYFLDSDNIFVPRIVRACVIFNYYAVRDANQKYKHEGKPAGWTPPPVAESDLATRCPNTSWSDTATQVRAILKDTIISTAGRIKGGGEQIKVAYKGQEISTTRCIWDQFSLKKANSAYEVRRCQNISLKETQAQISALIKRFPG